MDEKKAAEPDDLGAPSSGAADDSVYDPSTIEVNRGREQGLGMGAADLARQRDLPLSPTLPHAAEPDADDEAEK